MKCSICQSETPPQYPHGITAFICHTCKALGRVIESAFSPDSVEPEMPASEIEATKTVEGVQGSARDAQTAQKPASEPVEPDPQTEQTIAEQIEEPVPNPQGKQIIDQEPTMGTKPEQPAATKTDVDTGKRKTKKLK